MATFCIDRNFILDFLMFLFMISKSNPLDGEKKTMPNFSSIVVGDSYIGDGDINWHTHSGKLFGI